jgi:hypothetical protein
MYSLPAGSDVWNLSSNDHPKCKNARMSAWTVVADGLGRPANGECTHVSEILEVEPATSEGCEDCLRIGGSWVHLRECLTCGHVACCDSSPNKHATAHFRESQHPIVRSLEPGEAWAWCYVDKFILENE